MRNSPIGILYTCTAILALSFLLSGCATSPLPASLPTIAVTAQPTATSAPVATATLPPTASFVPTAIATEPPTATATLAATPTQAPTIAPTLALTVTAATVQVAISTDTCLGCHGPFDKLASETADYVWQNGSQATPHRYVPHDSKNIPECTTCHKPHPLPPTASDNAAIAEPNAQSCFACHHTGALECGTCHEIPEACQEATSSCGP